MFKVGLITSIIFFCSLGRGNCQTPKVSGSYSAINCEEYTFSGIRLNPDSTYYFTYASASESYTDTGTYTIRTPFIILNSQVESTNENTNPFGRYNSLGQKKLKLTEKRIYYVKDSAGYSPSHVWIKKPGIIQILYNMEKQIAKSGVFTLSYTLYTGLWYTFDDEYSLMGLRCWDEGKLVRDSLVIPSTQSR